MSAKNSKHRSKKSAGSVVSITQTDMEWLMESIGNLTNKIDHIEKNVLTKFALKSDLAETEVRMQRHLDVRFEQFRDDFFSARLAGRSPANAGRRLEREGVAAR